MIDRGHSSGTEANRRCQRSSSGAAGILRREAQDVGRRAAASRRRANGPSSGASASSRSIGNSSTAAPRRSPGTPWKRSRKRRKKRRSLPKRARAARRPSDSPSRLHRSRSSDKPYDQSCLQAVRRCRAKTWTKPFARRVFFWPRQTGPKGDLVDDEMGRVLQVPGWSNIFTQPIINRIEMLSTGVRTDIGVKVFGPDLDTIDRVCKEIEAALEADQRRPRRDRRPDHGQGLSANRHRPRAGGPLRHLGRGHSERDRSRAGRPGRHVHGREARPLSRAHSLRPRRSRRRGEHPPTAGQSRRHDDSSRANGAHPVRWHRHSIAAAPPRSSSRRPATTNSHAALRHMPAKGKPLIPLERRGRRPDRRRAGDDQERERPAAELRDAQRPRPRHRGLRRRGPARRRPEGQAARRRPYRVERRVRASGPRRADAAVRLSGGDRADLRDPVPDLPRPGRRRR